MWNIRDSSVLEAKIYAVPLSYIFISPSNHVAVKAEAGHPDILTPSHLVIHRFSESKLHGGSSLIRRARALLSLSRLSSALPGESRGVPEPSQRHNPPRACPGSVPGSRGSDHQRSPAFDWRPIHIASDHCEDPLQVLSLWEDGSMSLFQAEPQWVPGVRARPPATSQWPDQLSRQATLSLDVWSSNWGLLKQLFGPSTRRTLILGTLPWTNRPWQHSL